MLASRPGRSRLWWFLGVVALVIAIKLLAGGGDGDDGDGDRGAAAARDDRAADRDGAHAAWLGSLTARVRDASLARLSVPSGELRLEGVARDLEHQPLAGVHVTLGAGARTTETEADGTFFFDGLAEGDAYAVRAELGPLYAEAFDIRLTATSDPIELELRAGPSIHVRVVETTGDPIAGAHVESLDRAATTDRDGRATLRAVGMSRVNYTVTAAGHAPKDDALPTGDDPGATFERTVVLARGSPVFGTVVDEDGKLVANALVDVDDAQKERHEGIFADEHGVWTVPDLATGDYVASASSTVHVATPNVAFHHDAGGTQRGVVIHVAMGAQIRGTVVDTSGTPVAEARVSAGGAGADTDAHGAFVITGLPPDAYDVYASTPTAASKSQKIAIARGDRKEARFVLVPSGIAGFVVDPRGAPIEDARIAASGSGDANARGFDKTDDLGHFDLGGLPPGDYELTATRDGDKDRRDAVPVHVSTGNRKVRIVLPELAAIRGRVVLDGVPVPYFGYALVEDPESLRFEGPVPVRDPDGAFTVTGLRAGTRAIAIVGPGFVRKLVEGIRLTSGDVTDLGDIAVEHGREVHGHVMDAEAHAVAGATVSIHGRRSATDTTALDGLIDDRYTARTDAQGAYTIDGIAPQPAGDSAPSVIIEAQTAHGKSRARVLGADETEVDLVVSAIGTIAGKMDPVLATTALVVAVRDGDELGMRLYANPDEAGAFAFEPLPVGAYTVHVTGTWVMASKHVEVLADHTTVVDYPAEPVLASVRVHWPSCGYLALRPAATDDDEQLAALPCTEDGGDVVTFDSVVPGAYRLCDGDDCEAIDVPALALVAIEGHPAPPPPPPPPADPDPEPDPPPE